VSLYGVRVLGVKARTDTNAMGTVVLPVKGVPTVSGSPEAGEAGSHL